MSHFVVFVIRVQLLLRRYKRWDGIIHLGNSMTGSATSSGEVLTVFSVHLLRRYFFMASLGRDQFLMKIEEIFPMLGGYLRHPFLDTVLTVIYVASLIWLIIELIFAVIIIFIVAPRLQQTRSPTPIDTHECPLEYFNKIFNRSDAVNTFPAFHPSALIICILTCSLVLTT